ncbi:YhdT family protein [Natribacillus halophilus]|uniref:Uncharacterized membrane protein YhdT n=1 Tax=Natribacillus halophilus TaxID=549003 RepID=A0A1G8KTQ3_9BACI|nr:YhdT family protein [Natribacillus halophilus]SDI46818.1 Uncharacterized membrane protein YhdT [Natribacillus halophilus]
MNDPRFKIANREALIGVGLALFNFIWWYAFAYGLGSQPVADYDFIFGMPAWFFYSCLIGSVIMIILVVFMVKFFFKEVPLNEKGDESS